MKLIITKDVQHKFNERYACLMVQFEEDDKHYFGDKSNWMPKDEEVIAIIKLMRMLSPTFESKFKQEFL